MATDTITRWLTDESNPNSIAARARRRRSYLLAATFPDFADMSVVDLGGLVTQWTIAPVRPRKVTVVNLFDQPSSDGIEAVVADAYEFASHAPERFDLVYSNSVIDQVGGHNRRLAFAGSVTTLAPRHWIQTAYRYFPVDAYTLFPFQQLLPLSAQALVTRHWRFGHRHATNWHESVLANLHVELLSATALKAYFPESSIVRERWCGLTKSIIAVSAIR